MGVPGGGGRGVPGGRFRGHKACRLASLKCTICCCQVLNNPMTLKKFPGFLKSALPPLFAVGFLLFRFLGCRLVSPSRSEPSSTERPPLTTSPLICRVGDALVCVGAVVECLGRISPRAAPCRGLGDVLSSHRAYLASRHHRKPPDAINWCFAPLACQIDAPSPWWESFSRTRRVPSAFLALPADWSKPA
jgi:hypothetical protein